MIIKVGAACLNQTPMDIEGNIQRIQSVIDEAQSQNIDLLCLPELCVTGYGCEDAFFYQDFLESAYRSTSIITIDKDKKDIAFSYGLPIVVDGSLYNCNVMVVNAEVVGIVPKRKLAIDGVHYENRWFKEWPKGKIITYNSCTGKKVLFGDLIFDINGVKVGFETCEEAWVPNRTGRDLCERGVDVILNPSASHFSFGKNKTRRDFVREGSRAFSCGYVYSNLLGNEAGRIIYDGDCLIAANGVQLSEGKRFSFDSFQLTSACIDIDDIRAERLKRNGFQVDREYLGESRVFSFFNYTNKGNQTEPCDCVDYTKDEEFSKAASLGLFDYMRKTYSKGYIVSLSGGADSSAVSVLVALMKKYSFEELGERVYDRLGVTKEEFDNILRCYYLRTKNSSKETLESAVALAVELNAVFDTIDVDDVIGFYEEKAEFIAKRQLSWGNDNITKQNIQARARAPMVWMFANMYNAILLTTSNRSEAAVGYATMDGDTSGGLNPIGGIDKAYIRKWLVYMESTYASLNFVNNLQPSAELKPLEAKQTDEKDLMPYEVLNEIENCLIGKKKSLAKTLDYVNIKFEGTYATDDLEKWVLKFSRLWSVNQWKRERYAPSFHLDDRSLDPKTWCRFPILSGGFQV